MNRALRLSIASVALLGVTSPAWFGGCSSPSSTSPDAGDDLLVLPDVGQDSPSSCPPDVKAGGSCEPIAPDKVYCAPSCEGGTGGCYCVSDPKLSKGVWMCTADNCGAPCAPDSDGCVLEGGLVDSGPIPDTFVPPDVGAEAGDGPADATAEAHPG